MGRRVRPCIIQARCTSRAQLWRRENPLLYTYRGNHECIYIYRQYYNKQATWILHSFGLIRWRWHWLTHSSVARLTLKLFPFYRAFNGYNFRKLCSSSIDCNQWCLLQSKNNFIRQSKVVVFVRSQRVLTCMLLLLLCSLKTINAQNNRRFIYYRNLQQRFTSSHWSKLICTNSYWSFWKI